MIVFFQKGFNYSQDGPGNRLVYHLQGCNFRCPWCANPEGLETVSSKSISVNIEDIVDEACRSRMMFFDGGGVTLTGGEVTIQFDEVKKLLSELKKSNINTCIETNGSHPKLKELLPYIDHLIMDIKHFNPEMHLYWTKSSGENTINNYKYLCDNKIPALIRIPLINNVNTIPDSFVDFLSSFQPNNQNFEVLKYHEYGKGKWTTPYKITNGFVTNEQYTSFVNTLKNKGLTVINT